MNHSASCAVLMLSMSSYISLTAPGTLSILGVFMSVSEVLVDLAQLPVVSASSCL